MIKQRFSHIYQWQVSLSVYDKVHNKIVPTKPFILSLTLIMNAMHAISNNYSSVFENQTYRLPCIHSDLAPFFLYALRLFSDIYLNNLNSVYLILAKLSFRDYSRYTSSYNGICSMKTNQMATKEPIHLITGLKLSIELTHPWLRQRIEIGNNLLFEKL